MTRRMTAYAAVAVLTASTILWGSPDDGTPEEPVHPARINKPQDFAPAEQVIVPRDPAEYRPKGSLLGTAHHEPRRVDTDELLRRKYDLYEGQVLTRTLPGPDGSTPTGTPEASPTPEAARPRGPAVVVWWTFVGGCTVLALCLGAGAWLNVRRRSSRTAPRDPLSSRTAEGPRGP